MSGKGKVEESKPKSVSPKKPSKSEPPDERQSPLFMPVQQEIQEKAEVKPAEEKTSILKNIPSVIDDVPVDVTTESAVEKKKAPQKANDEEVDVIEAAIKRLIEQIKSGKGKWLASMPEKNGNSFEVDKRTLQLMTDELVGVELMTVHFKMRSFGLRVKETKLIYTGE